METERRIEKLLRAFAKKRKADAGAPLELHPATRRLLQDEVARAAKTGGERTPLWLILFASKPRLVFALGVVVSLGVSVILLLPALNQPKSKTLLAENKRASAAKALKPVETPAPVVAPVATVADGLKTEVNAPGGLPVADNATAAKNGSDKEGLYKKDAPPVANRFAEVSGQSVGGFGGGGGAGGGFGVRKDETILQTAAVPATPPPGLDGKSGLAFDAPATSAAPAQPSSTFALTTSGAMSGFGGRGGGGGGGRGGARFENMDRAKLEQSRNQVVSQNFSRLVVAGEMSGVDEKQKTPAVLDSFAVEQDGDKMTVVDQDGSKYSGFIQVAAANAESISTVRPQPAPGASAKVATAPQQRTIMATDFAAAFAPAQSLPLASQNYFFRVAGTNRSLNQAVVFSGNLVANTNLVSATNFQQMSQPGVPTLQLLNSRITGRASVNGKSEIQINAAPVQP